MAHRPDRKNPVLRTPEPTVPPAARSRVAQGLTAGAARGRLELQVCAACGTVQYPPREACRACLSTDLPWRPIDGGGTLVAGTVLHHAQELYFRERVPWRLGLVRLDAGPTLVAHLHAACDAPPARVRVVPALDRAGAGALVACPEAPVSLADDPTLREFTCDPRGRNILVTDATSAVGQAVVRALLKAGAALVWGGEAEPWKARSGFNAVRALPGVMVVPLDVTDTGSVEELAGTIGHKVDILINTAEHHRPGGLAGGIGTARESMEVNALGLLRLAQSFGPALKARGADGERSAIAWVNLLSIDALAPPADQGAFAASKAAALSLAQTLRADLRPAGLRVINVFPGPVDTDWNQRVMPPKITPAALARAIVEALNGSVEDVYPGDVAQDWLARWRDDPKSLEREVAP